MYVLQKNYLNNAFGGFGHISCHPLFAKLKGQLCDWYMTSLRYAYLPLLHPAQLQRKRLLLLLLPCLHQMEVAQIQQEHCRSHCKQPHPSVQGERQFWGKTQISCTGRWYHKQTLPVKGVKKLDGTEPCICCTTTQLFNIHMWICIQRSINSDIC